MEPSAEAENLAASGLRGGGLVQVQGPRLPDANQPDPAESDGRGEEEGGREVGFKVEGITIAFANG